MGEQSVEKDVGETCSSAGLVASILAVRVVAERVEDKVLGIRHGGAAGGRQMDEGYDGTLEPDGKTVFGGYGRTEGFEDRDEGRQLVRSGLDMLGKEGAQFVVQTIAFFLRFSDVVGQDACQVVRERLWCVGVGEGGIQGSDDIVQ